MSRQKDEIFGMDNKKVRIRENSTVDTKDRLEDVRAFVEKRVLIFSEK